LRQVNNNDTPKFHVSGPLLHEGIKIVVVVVVIKIIMITLYIERINKRPGNTKWVNGWRLSKVSNIFLLS